MNKKVRKKRVPSKGGFTKFFYSKEQQVEFESLQMQAIMYFDDGSIPF